MPNLGANRTYETGHTISVQATFNQPVNVEATCAPARLLRAFLAPSHNEISSPEQQDRRAILTEQLETVVLPCLNL